MADSDSDINRLTAKRSTQAVLDFLKGKTTIVKESRQGDLTPSEVDG